MSNTKPHPYHAVCTDPVDTDRQSTIGLLKWLRSPLDITSSRPSSYTLISIASGQKLHKHQRGKKMSSHHREKNHHFLMKNYIFHLLISIFPICPKNWRTLLKSKREHSGWWYPCNELSSCMVKLLNLRPHLHLMSANPPLLGLCWCSRSQSSFAQLQHHNRWIKKKKWRTTSKDTFWTYSQVQKLLIQNYAGLMSGMGSVLELSLVYEILRSWRKGKVMLRKRIEKLFLFQCIFSLLGSEITINWLKYLCMYINIYTYKHKYAHLHT